MPPPEFTPVAHNVVPHTVSQGKVLDLNGDNGLAQPINKAQGQAPTLGGSLNSFADGEISFSKSGAGGALLFQPQDPTRKGLAVKVEEAESAKNAFKCSEMMENFFQNAQGPQPFVAPRITLMTGEELRKNSQVLNQLNAKHKLAFDKTGADQKGQIDDAKRRLGGLEDPDKKDTYGRSTGEFGVITMEFADGTQLNKLPLDEKLALIKGGGFGKTMGRAMAPLMAMGMNDHIGVGLYGTNPTNFLYNPKSGQLSVIDYSSAKEVGVDAAHPLIGLRSGDASRNMRELADELNTAFVDQDTFDQRLHEMLNPSSMLDVSVSHLSQAMQNFVTSGQNNLFSAEENPKVVTGERTAKSGAKVQFKEGPVDLALTQEDRERFAVNMMDGMLDGIEYMQQNEQAFRAAVKNGRETVQGQTLEHFYTDQELDDFCTAMKSVDVNKCRQDLAQRVKGMEQKVDQRIDNLATRAKEITDRTKKLESRIERIENHPSFADRLKKMVNQKGDRPLDRAKAELAQLKQEGSQIEQEATKLINKRDYNAELKQQIENPQPKVNAPHTSVRKALEEGEGHKVSGQGIKTDAQEVDQPQQSQTNKPRVGQNITLGSRGKQGTPTHSIGAS